MKAQLGSTTKEKAEPKCKRKIAGTKQVIMGKHSYVKSFDPRYLLCSVCGHVKKAN